MQNQSVITGVRQPQQRQPSLRQPSLRQPSLRQPLLWLSLLLLVLCSGTAQAVTYANTSYTFNWIDASSHTKVGYNTAPYKFTQAQGTNCQTREPTLDDTMSGPIPIGFTFSYGGSAFTTVYVQTNGRLQFGNVYCGYGSPVQVYPYPDTNMNYTMRVYGNDLDPTTNVDVPGYGSTCASIATCYVSVATIGTAPNRSFVVTWNNVPEWVQSSAPKGGYNLQVILQENGEFIYQYGAVNPGPNASTGQVGWQVSTTDYDAPKTGIPPANSAIKFYIPQPVAEYRMEQSSWTSAAGQVIDSSGNSRNGTALGNAQTVSGGKVCRAANFPANTLSGTIDAINTGISVPTTVGGAGTITFWYKGNTAWSGTGVVDAQLLDASVVNGQWFFLVRRSNGNLRFVVTDNGGTVYSAETAANAVAANTWAHIAVSWNFNQLVAANSDHLRVYVNGALKLEQAFSSANTISSQIGTLYVGDNRSGFIGSNGSANSANGAIDEFRVYNYEGGSTLVLRDYNLGASGCLNHYAISHSGTGSTCGQSTITITAHDSAHANITMPNNTTSINLSALLSGGTNRGDWTLISGYGTLNNGSADDGSATYLFNGEYQAVFGYTLSVADTVNFNITDGQFIESEDPNLVVSACLTNRFNACELTATRCVPTTSGTTYARLNTKLANTAFVLDAVKLKSDGSLETTFNGSVTLDLLANSQLGVALSSNNCPSTQTAVIPLGSATFASGRAPSAGVSVGTTAFSAVSPGYSAYRDVRVRFTCSAGSCGTAQTACSTDNFAVRPTGFTISSSMSNATQTGTPSLNAGAAFTLTSTAVGGYDGTPLLDNRLSGQKVVTHVSNTDYTAALSVPSGSAPFPVGASVIATGAVSNATVRYDDTGNFSVLKDGLVDSSFTSTDQPTDCVKNSSSNTANISGQFGCNIANQSNTALFGRFYPDHYGVYSSVYGVCSGMVYLGQSGLGVTSGAIAYSKNDVILSKLSGTGVTYAVTGDNSGASVALAARLTPALPTYGWAAGRNGRYHTTDTGTYAIGSTSINLVGQGTLATGEVIGFAGDNNLYTVATGVTGSGTLVLNSPGLKQAIASPSIAVHEVHTFSRTGTTEGPYDSLSVKTTITDADGGKITLLNGTGVTATASVLSSASAKLRYGRLRIANAYGSELLQLPVDVTAQYWNGSAYYSNTLDNCTTLPAASFSIDTWSGGVTAVNLPSSNIPASSGTLVSGAGKIRLAKPVSAPASKGSFNLNSLIPYLPGFGRETLGVYKNGPTLYIREIY